MRNYITAPWYESDNPEFHIFAYNQQKIEDFINRLARAPDPNDFETQIAIYAEVGLDGDSLTDDEIKYIEREVARRI